jgi:hypothetical protein
MRAAMPWPREIRKKRELLMMPRRARKRARVRGLGSLLFGNSRPARDHSRQERKPAAAERARTRRERRWIQMMREGTGQAQGTMMYMSWNLRSQAAGAPRTPVQRERVPGRRPVWTGGAGSGEGMGELICDTVYSFLRSIRFELSEEALSFAQPLNGGVR